MTYLNRGENYSESIALDLGSQYVADRFFSEFPPTFDEIDGAINYIEEELDKIKDEFNNIKVLFTDDEIGEHIAQLAYNTSKEDVYISIPQIELENVFNRFAAIVKGLPASQDVLPDNIEFAAYLLIIREVMHHLNFEKLVVKIN